MKSKKEVRDWIVENCKVSYRDIDLSCLDFKGYHVYLAGMKADTIVQGGHEAQRVFQENHRAEYVLEGSHQKPKKKIRFSFPEEITEEQRDAILKILRG